MLCFHVGETKSAIWKKVNCKFIFHKLDLTDYFLFFQKKTHFLQCLNKQFSPLWSHACCNGQLSAYVCVTYTPASSSGLNRHSRTVAQPHTGVAQSWSLMQIFPVICNTANLALHPCTWLSSRGNLPFGLFFSPGLLVLECFSGKAFKNY